MSHKEWVPHSQLLWVEQAGSPLDPVSALFSDQRPTHTSGSQVCSGDSGAHGRWGDAVDSSSFATVICAGIPSSTGHPGTPATTSLADPQPVPSATALFLKVPENNSTAPGLPACWSSWCVAGRWLRPGAGQMKPALLPGVLFLGLGCHRHSVLH